MPDSLYPPRHPDFILNVWIEEHVLNIDGPKMTDEQIVRALRGLATLIETGGGTRVSAS